MRDWFYNFMRYRNGTDTLNRFLLLVCIITEIVFMFTRISVFSFIATFIIILCIFRMLSKNIPARQRENEFFLGLKDKILRKKDRKDSNYKFFICTGCGRTLRVPKGRGKIEMRCPICGVKRICRT